MKKTIALLNTIIMLTLLMANGLDLTVFAQNTADSNDVFYVNTPNANQKVKGTIQVSWVMYDDDRDAIPFTAELFDRNSCKDVNYGSVTSQILGSSSLVNPNVVSWDTNSTQSTASLSDGEYCLRICAVFQNDGSDYSVCNGRPVLILNNNELPQITSSPDKTTVYNDESWQYQIQASDPDGDTISYRFLVSPDFLNINSQTGVITKISNVTLPSTTSYADYEVVVAADDNLSGYASQRFILRVVNRNYIATSITGSSPSTDNSGSVQGANQSGKLTIIFPKENSVLKGSENLLEWEAEDPDGIKEVRIAYSASLENWIEVAQLRGDTENYNWDVTNISDGSYYLQLTIVDKKEAVVSYRSPRFNILNKLDGDEVESPLIINLSPSNDSTTSEVREISGNFVPSKDNTIETESFKIILNETDITESCEVTEARFVCTLEEPLADGKSSAEATVQDTSGEKVEAKWTFTVGDFSEADENVTIAGRQISSRTLMLLVIVCCVSSILLLVPWILYSLWSKRNDNDDDYYMDNQTQVTTYPDTSPVTYTEPYYYDPAPVQPQVTTNYYYPDQTTYASPSTPSQPNDLGVNTAEQQTQQPADINLNVNIDPNSPNTQVNNHEDNNNNS